MKKSGGGPTPENYALDCRFQSVRILHSEFKKMNRDITDITDLALANILDVIPLISNTGEEVNLIILRIYDRNAAVLEQN